MQLGDPITHYALRLSQLYFSQAADRCIVVVKPRSELLVTGPFLPREKANYREKSDDGQATSSLVNKKEIRFEVEMIIFSRQNQMNGLLFRIYLPAYIQYSKLLHIYMAHVLYYSLGIDTFYYK